MSENKQRSNYNDEAFESKPSKAENDEMKKLLLDAFNKINNYFDEKENDDFENNIQSFVKSRISFIKKDETPTTLEAGGKVILHLIPFKSFKSNGKPIDLKLIENHKYSLRPLGSSSWDYRYNFDGYLTFNNFSYIQIFRNGCIETVSNYFYDYDKKTINAFQFEVSVVNNLPKYIEVLNNQGIEGPFYVFITFTEIRSFGIQKRSGYLFLENYMIDKNEVILPKIKNKKTENIELLMKSPFDILWNAGGIPESLNYKYGKWKNK